MPGPISRRIPPGCKAYMDFLHCMNENSGFEHLPLRVRNRIPFVT
jgi:hypothetical protein